MKKLLLIAGYFVLSNSLFADNGIDSLLKVLDKTVDNYQVYSNKKEEKMNKMKDLLRYTTSYDQKYEICGKLSNGQNIMSYFVPKLFNTNDKRSLRF